MINLEEKFSMSENLYWKEKIDGYIYIYNKYSKTGCYITEKEFALLRNLNGLRDYYRLREENLVRLSEKGYSIFINKLISLNLLSKYEIKRKNKILQFKVGLFNPNQWLEKYVNIVYNIFVFAFVVSIPILILGLSLIDVEKYIAVLKEMINVKSGMIMYIVSFTFLTLHELSHGVVAKKMGAEVVEIGLMIYLFIPFVYVTIGGTKELTDEKKLLISSAGIIMNVFCLGAILLIVGKNSCYNNVYVATAVLSNLGQILVNINPFLQVDSCYIIESLLGIEDMHNNTSLEVKKKFGAEERMLREIYRIISKANTMILFIGVFFILLMYLKEKI